MSVSSEFLTRSGQGIIDTDYLTLTIIRNRHSRS